MYFITLHFIIILQILLYRYIFQQFYSYYGVSRDTILRYYHITIIIILQKLSF